MTAPTVNVAVHLSTMLGVDCAGVAVTVKMDKNDAYAGNAVIAVSDRKVADSGGIVNFALFPNNPTTGLGTTGSVYEFTARAPAGKAFHATAQIPNSDCNLTDVMDRDVVPGISAAQAAQATAQAAAAEASDDAADTAADRTQTGLDRAQTGADRTQTWLDRAATAADRLQTGLDRTAADASAATALAAATKTVRVDVVQSFTSGEQAQARSNMAISAANTPVADDASNFITKTVEAALAQLAAKHGKTLYTSDIATFDGTGTNDVSTLLSAAIASTAAAGVRLHINSPIVKCAGRVVTVDDARVSMEPGCYLLRNFTSAGNTGFIGPAASGTASNRVWLWGIKVVGPDYDTYTGNVFDIHGDDCEVFFPIVKTYGAGRAFLVRGNRVTIYEPFVTDPKQVTGVGGIRVLSGDSFRCIGGNVYAGDDVFQFVPAAAGGTDITNGQYIGCSGYSYAARLFVAALVDQQNVGGMTANIKDVAFIGVKGGSGVKAFDIENSDSSGYIDGVDIIGCSCDMTNSTSPDASTLIGKTTGGNEMRNVRIRGMGIRNPYQRALKASGGQIRGLKIDGFSADKARSAGQPAIQLFGVVDGSMSNTDVWCNGTDGIQIGPNLADPDNNRCTSFHVRDGVKVRDVPNGKAAVLYIQATGCTADGVYPIRAAGATTSIGLKFQSGAISCFVGPGNTWTDIDTQVSDAGDHTSYGVRTFVATSDPAVTDDSSKGVSINSRWTNTATEVAFTCVDPTVGAAVWRKDSRAPSYRTGRFYPTYSGTLNTTTAVPAVDTIYLQPFYVQEKCTVSSLAGRVSTAGTGSSAKAAVWVSKAGKPFGAPVLVDNTGVATTSGTAAVSHTVSGTLTPGWYWIGTKHTGTLPQYVSASQTDGSVQELTGRTAVGGQTFVTALSYAHAYATAFPTFDGTESYTDVVTNGVPVMYFGL